jgi:hypothetical protein
VHYHEPKYPVYVPSKGRWHACQTVKFLLKDGCPFSLVVEPQEAARYRASFPTAPLLVLPFQNQGSVIPARNWIKEHATSLGYERHWQLDDNIALIKRRWYGKRVPCKAGIALRVTEEFVDRYQNIAVAGLNYEMFLPNGQWFPPFQLNCHVYSCTLVLNSLPYGWRIAYNDDTDLCLHVIADGWCTVLMNCFLCQKMRTMVVTGGNTTALYQGDGRLKMARELQRIWPGVVETKRRFRRPQHVVHKAWKDFDTQLILKPGVEIPQGTNEFGMEMVRTRATKSPTFHNFLKRHGKTD